MQDNRTGIERSVAAAAVWVIAVWAVPAWATDLGEMAEKGTESLSAIPGFLQILMYIIGFIGLIAGIVMCARAKNNPQQGYGAGISVALVGVMLMLGPLTVDWIAGTFGIDTQGGVPDWSN